MQHQRSDMSRNLPGAGTNLTMPIRNALGRLPTTRRRLCAGRPCGPTCHEFGTTSSNWPKFAVAGAGGWASPNPAANPTRATERWTTFCGRPKDQHLPLGLLDARLVTDGGGAVA